MKTKIVLRAQLSNECVLWSELFLLRNKARIHFNQASPQNQSSPSSRLPLRQQNYMRNRKRQTKNKRQRKSKTKQRTGKKRKKKRKKRKTPSGPFSVPRFCVSPTGLIGFSNHPFFSEEIWDSQITRKKSGIPKKCQTVEKIWETQKSGWGPAEKINSGKSLLKSVESFYKVVCTRFAHKWRGL